ncbi:hypothetical protein KJ359_000639 [Pestalotiopsis sp. 9143b]|nr:hypothetical protein KJ359_000639 [Pestalotiopsis sp. 9143b]
MAVRFAARGRCQEALDTLLETTDVLHFEISRRTGKYEHTVHFDNGAYIHFISVREGLLTVDLRKRGMIDVLRDLARQDGIHGRESRGSNHADDPHLAHETGEPQAREPIEDFLDACQIETSQISYPCVEGAYSYLIQAAHSIGLENETTTVFVAVHYLLQNNTSVELWDSEERPGVRAGVVRTHFGVELHLETEDLARFDVSLNDRVLFGKIVDAVCQDVYRHVFSDGVVYGYVQKRF